MVIWNFRCIVSAAYKAAPQRPTSTIATQHSARRRDLRRAVGVKCSQNFPQTWYHEDSNSPHELLEIYRQRQSQCPSSGEGRLGTVYLVGTGPGDPGLLTLKAIRVLQTADVVFYDRLVSEDILRLTNPGALMIYVGKQQSYHTRSQGEIHELLKSFATDVGATVVRLKGGDPYIFGRGGEEMEYLMDRGVTVRCIPGITAASGISAELGIPLTHRGFATSVRFLTGHAREGGEQDVDDVLCTSVDDHTTLVIYMGLSTLNNTSKQLIHKGLDPKTPCAAIERGTTPDQRVVWATLDNLAEEVEGAQLKSPTLIVIGKVVSVAPGWKVAMATGSYHDRPEAQVLPLPQTDGLYVVDEGFRMEIPEKAPELTHPKRKPCSSRDD